MGLEGCGILTAPHVLAFMNNFFMQRPQPSGFWGVACGLRHAAVVPGGHHVGVERGAERRALASEKGRVPPMQYRRALWSSTERLCVYASQSPRWRCLYPLNHLDKPAALTTRWWLRHGDHLFFSSLLEGRSPPCRCTVGETAE